MKTVLFLLLCPTLLWAQTGRVTPEDRQRKQSYLILRDGSVVRGQIMRQDSSLITVRQRGGVLTFVEADQLVRISADRPDAATTGTSAPTPYTVFVLKDGVRLEGQFVRRDSTMITVRKRDGRLTYFEPELLVRTDSVQTDVAAARTSPATQPSRRTYPNRFSPYLLTGQTAHNPEKRRLYYRNTLLFANEINYGLTRHWSVGASINPFFALYDAINNPREIVLTASTRFSTKLSAPIGSQFRFGLFASYQPAQQGALYRIMGQWTAQGLTSFGDSQRNVTLGYGLRFYEGVGGYKTSFVTAGVMHKLSGSLTFISDNTFYLNPFTADASAYLSAALRIDRRRHAFDLGVLAGVYPRYFYYYYGRDSDTRATFSPYLGYNLLIGRP